MTRTLCGAALAALWIFVPTAAAEDVPCSQLLLPYDQIPLEELGWIQIDVGQPLVFSVPGDPVTAIRVGEPGLSDAEAPLVCGADYRADLTGGVATVVFERSLPFYVEVDFQSGVQLAGHAMVDCQPLDQPQCGAGRQYPVETPVGDVVLVGDTVMPAACRITEWTGKKKDAKTEDAAKQAICDAYAANGNQPVDVTIVTHGASGALDLGGIGSRTITNANVCEFATCIKEKVMGKKIILVSCSVGAFENGETFVCELADKTCTKVSSATRGVTLCGNGTIKISCAPLFEKDSRPGVIIDEPVEGSGAVADPGVGLVFPLDSLTHAQTPLSRLIDAWGTADARWDVDRTGNVGFIDALLVISAFGM